MARDLSAWKTEDATWMAARKRSWTAIMKLINQFVPFPHVKKLLCLVLLITPVANAAWVRPVKVLSGAWGAGPSAFYVDWGDSPVYAVYPSITDVAKDGTIAISNTVNLKLYSGNGQWIRNITPPYDPSKWGITPRFVGGNVVLPVDNYYFISRDGTLLAKHPSPGKADFIGEFDGKLYIAVVAPAKQWVVYASDGNILNIYAEKPLELGRVRDGVFGYQGRKMHRVTVSFPDHRWVIVNESGPCGEYSYRRDAEGTLYCVGEQQIERYSACGKVVAEVGLPKIATVTRQTAPAETGAEDVIEVVEQYSGMVMGDDGSVYSSRITQADYSVVKWTWQASPDDSIGGPDAPIDLAIASSTGAVTLSWVHSLQDPGCVTQYEIGRSQVAGGPYTALATVPATPGAKNYRYTDNTAQVGIIYYYAVRAISAIGDSDYSNEVSAKAE